MRGGQFGEATLLLDAHGMVLCDFACRCRDSLRGAREVSPMLRAREHLEGLAERQLAHVGFIVRMCFARA
jgi:hypothetical protein